jgi:hypothetical protein
MDPVDIDHWEERMAAMRARAEHETGEASLAGILIRAFLDPEADKADLNATTGQ